MPDIIASDVRKEILVEPPGTPDRLCPGGQLDRYQTLFVDAGTRHFRVLACGDDGAVLQDRLVPSNTDLRELFSTGPQEGPASAFDPARIVITGKLASAVHERLGGGKQVLSAAAFWLAAQDLIRLPENADVTSLAIVDLSASGYLLLGVDRDGMLKDDLLLTNPRCGAGSGINLDRVLQKLAVDHEEVDALLHAYLGEAGRIRREDAAVRVDRCGVFATSATISDKNQGIPLDTALATTLKSEILKTMGKLPHGFDKVYLTGRIFRWQFTRDCAEDLLRKQGVESVEYDTEGTQILRSVQSLVDRVGIDNIAQPDRRLLPQKKLQEYPSFATLRRRYETGGRYRRLEGEPALDFSPAELAGRPLIMALDVGSTMAKVVVADSETDRILFLEAYSNAGDTIETVKKVFSDLRQLGIERLPLQSVGITGSARYQVQQALSRIYPVLANRVSVLVENYAHARGSIDYARRHIQWLQAQGIEDVDSRLCILVDIGGEDTKITTIAINEAELFDNAMNTKCSAGTGSLMDTLGAMFGLESVAEAQLRACSAERSFAISATCAVFLMENASKLQARGVPTDEILASANWAVVENMARTLWGQLHLPANAVVLLHGQTMVSDPLPLAVTHRLRSYIGAEVYALVPPHPGHRACIGLIRSLQQAAVPGTEEIRLNDLLEADFERRVIQCRGTVCGDPQARCNRCLLRWRGDKGQRIGFSVGGCTSINELISQKAQHKGKEKARQAPDAYNMIWDFIDSRHPRSDHPNRLVIPRSFAVSEWAYFLARIFEQFAVPVHVDNVRDTDLSDAHPRFNVDCCAPQMGAVGQYERLASEPHGMILAPQIETLPTDGLSSGLTCTTNQGGIAVAANLAELAHPDARFHLFHFRIDELDAGSLCDELLERLQPVFDFYGISTDAPSLQQVISGALAKDRQLRREAEDFAAGLAEEALDDGFQVALVVGREYILNPGIYDSNVRRLLRDRRLAVIPSYVLDVDLDPEFSKVYWRNPHVILTLLKAVAQRKLHRCLRNPRLQSVFRRIEEDPSGRLLPVVQISTFSCGPDSIIAHYVAEIMKQRPFLLIQSDAVLKELAHMENRVNTYVKQLEQGLHDRLLANGGGHFEIRVLDELLSHEPLNRETDVICMPSLADVRNITAVFRGAGFTCIDSYTGEDDFDLQALVKIGREVAGQAVCTPLAAMYADLRNCVEEFARRKLADDPSLAGKQRLVLIDSEGPGPCRQGQYAGLHRLFFRQTSQDSNYSNSCNGLPAGTLFEFLLLNEDDGYGGGLEEWVILRIYQAAILKGVLQDILFKGGAACSDYEEYQRFIVAFRELQSEVRCLLGSYSGPGPFARRLLGLLDRFGLVGIPAKYFVYRLKGKEFTGLLRRFVSKWTNGRPRSADELEILVSGEAYMRVSQADEIFRILLGVIGFQRFHLRVSPVMAYLECLLEEAADASLCTLEVVRHRQLRQCSKASDDSVIRNEKRRLRSVKLLRLILDKVMARPLYKASRLEMPVSAKSAVRSSREILPTYRPIGELAPYIGEALTELRRGTDLVLNVAPTGCMVSSMGEVLTASITHVDGVAGGRVQTLMSAEGDVNEEVLTLAVLKSMGPQRYCVRCAQ